MVLTRKGYKPVIKKWDNGLKPVREFSFGNGQSLTATDTHSIITPAGKTPIRAITGRDEIFVLLNGGKEWKRIRNTRRSYLTACLIAGIQKASGAVIGFISDALIRKTERIRQKPFTSLFGSATSVLFQKAFTSITGMVTPSTIPLTEATTSFAENHVIYRSTPCSITRDTRQKCNKTSMQSDHLHQHGMEVKKGVVGMRNTLARLLMVLSQSSVCASNAVKSISEKFLLAKESSVLTLANQHGEGSREQTTSKRPASFAESLLSATNTRKSKLVAPTAAPSSVTRIEPVYNLTVDDQHEYFANGILVSNCIDTIRYALQPLIKGGFNWEDIIGGQED